MYGWRPTGCVCQFDCTISMEIIAIYLVRLVCNGLKYNERVMLRRVVVHSDNRYRCAGVWRVQIVNKSFCFLVPNVINEDLHGKASLIYLWFFCLGRWRHDICPRNHQRQHTHTNDMRAKLSLTCAYIKSMIMLITVINFFLFVFVCKLDCVCVCMSWS